MRVAILLPLVAVAIMFALQPTKPTRPQSLERAASDAQYEELSYGRTYFRVHGPSNSTKKRVVLVHGFSMGSDVAWGDVPQLLAAAGYRVLTFDLWGRGLSDEPGVDHSMSAFSAQLAEMVMSLEEFRREPFYLVGISMGGAVVAKFTDTHPALVDRLVLIAPAGAGKVPTPVSVQVLMMPVIGEFTLKFAPFLMEDALMKHVDRAFANAATATVANHIKEARELLQFNIRNHPGFLRALLSTLRHSRLSDGIMEGEYGRIGQHDRKTLLVWGNKDIVVPFENHGRVRELLPNATFVELDGVSHSIPEEFADLLVTHLLSFF